MEPVWVIVRSENNRIRGLRVLGTEFIRHFTNTSRTLEIVDPGCIEEGIIIMCTLVFGGHCHRIVE